MKMFTTLLILLMTSLLILNCSGDGEAASNAEAEAVTAIPVEVCEVETGSVSAYFSGTATLEAEEEATVVARVEGVVEEILVEEGDRVRAGQVLARLDKEKLAKQLSQSRANLNKLENEFKRSEQLFKQNLISAEEYQRAQSDFEAQKASFDLTQLEMNYASITAPITGVISERMIKVGNMISLYSPSFHITDFDPLHAILYVPENEIGKLAVGQKAMLQVDAHSGNDFPGEVLRISPVVDPQTGTVKVTVAVNDASLRLKPGMFSRVQIIYDVHDKTLVIPKQAVMAEDTESAVYIIRDSLAFRQTINIGYSNGTKIEVLTGLKAGDVVVTTGQGGLKDSAKVATIAMNDAH